MSGNDTDFRVLQTYGEIRQAIEDSAYSELADPEEGMEMWAAAAAKRIADHAVMCLDAADPS